MCQEFCPGGYLLPGGCLLLGVSAPGGCLLLGGCLDLGGLLQRVSAPGEGVPGTGGLFPGVAWSWGLPGLGGLLPGEVPHPTPRRLLIKRTYDKSEKMTLIQRKTDGQMLKITGRNHIHFRLHLLLTISVNSA